jgi:hypothetical protein
MLTSMFTYLPVSVDLCFHKLSHFCLDYFHFSLEIFVKQFPFSANKLQGFFLGGDSFSLRNVYYAESNILG